jgi:uncharacterized protein (TIRG00374 family)
MVFGLAVSVAMVWWAFHKYRLIDIWHQMLTAHPVPLLLAVFLATLPFALRVPRWQLLLRQDDGGKVAPMPMWRAISIGFAANNVLPLRAGEVLRVMAITRLAPVSFGSALSSLAIERVLDALMMILLLGAALVASHFPPDLTLGGTTPIRVFAARIGAACLAVLAAAVIAAWQRQRTLQLVRWILPHNKVGYVLHTFAERVLLGLDALRDFRRAAPVIAWTLVIWLVNAAAFYAVFRAFDFEVGFMGALILQGVLMIGIAIPQGPGFVGTFQLAFAATLGPLFAIPGERAVACGTIYQITTFLPIVLMGVYSAARSGVHLRVPHQGDG